MSHASSEVVMMALLGGTFALLGSVLGSGVFIFLSDLLNRFPALPTAGGWLLIFGVILILVVMFVRGGLYGGAEAIYGWLKERVESSGKQTATEN